jgi:hypothetical protein
MGGTGNTGATPEKQAGVQAGIAAGGDPALPQWGAGAAAPGEVAPQGGLPALTEAPPTLRPYEEATASTGTGAGPQTGLLAPAGAGAGPMGFQSDPYPTRSAAVDTFAAPAPAAAEAPKTPAEFAAPTSFAKPWDAMIGANGILSSRGQVGNDRNWNQNPEAVRQWLQAFADSGGDYRVQDQYYNLVSPGSGMKIYWPGDPARPGGT